MLEVLLLDNGVHVCGGHVGVYDAGGDGNDTDVAADQLAAELMGEADHSGLAGGIADAGGGAEQAGDGGGVDNDAGIVGLHVLISGPGAVVHALDVDVEHVLELALLDLAEHGGVGHAGVVDHDVNASPLGHDLAHGVEHLLAAGQSRVQAENIDVGVKLLELGQSSVNGLLAVAGNGHVSAVLYEKLGGGKADAAGTAGDEYYLVFYELHGSESFLLSIKV